MNTAGRLVDRLSPMIEALDEAGDDLEDRLLTANAKRSGRRWPN